MRAAHTSLDLVMGKIGLTSLSFHYAKFRHVTLEAKFGPHFLY